MNGKVITCDNCGLVVADEDILVDGLCSTCQKEDPLEDIIQTVDRVSKTKANYFNFED